MLKLTYFKQVVTYFLIDVKYHCDSPQSLKYPWYPSEFAAQGTLVHLMETTHVDNNESLIKFQQAITVMV